MNFTQQELTDYIEVADNAIASAGGSLTPMADRITHIQSSNLSNTVTFFTETISLTVYRTMLNTLHCAFNGMIPTPENIADYILDLHALQPICDGLHEQSITIPFPLY